MKAPRQLWDNLAGPPVIYSEAIRDRNNNDRRQHSGFLKLRLAHSNGRSYLIPDLLIGVGGNRYFLPHFFSPPIFAFNVAEGVHYVDFSIDVGPPRATNLARLLIRTSSRDYVRSYLDGAQLYQCSFEGPRMIARFASGLCDQHKDGDIACETFHHTKPETVAKIRSSGELWSSPWNLAGTRKLLNVSYGYLTCLPSIRSEEDLQRIAMSSAGKISFQTTSDRLREEAVSLDVYRESTSGRTASIALKVPAALFAPAHLYLHPMTARNPAYFEIIGSEIIRIGVIAGSTIPFNAAAIDSARVQPKSFTYVVLGDTSTKAGLVAPYHEEETVEIAHLEQLRDENVFQFWLRNSNSDQVAGRVLEPRNLEPPDGYS